MLRILSIITVSAIVILFSAACNKEVDEDDPRINYIGQWNFKKTIFSYSGYYIYNPDATWVSNTNTQISYDDSTGSIALGSNKDELIIKYCATCSERIVNLNNLGSGAEQLTYDSYEYIIQAPPPGYSSSYTTNTVNGQKL